MPIVLYVSVDNPGGAEAVGALVALLNERLEAAGERPLIRRPQTPIWGWAINFGGKIYDNPGPSRSE